MKVREIPPKRPGQKRTRAERVADAKAHEMKLRLENGFTPEEIGFHEMTAADVIKLEWWCSHDLETFVIENEAKGGVP